MVSTIDYILEGLEAALALERELGVRSIEFDRTLLQELSAPAPAPAAATAHRSVAATASIPAPAPASVVASTPAPASAGTDARQVEIAFLHHCALSEKGVEMMAKIINALPLPPGAAEVFIAPPRPAAKVYVVLGGMALKRWFPGAAGAPGQWIHPAADAKVLVTYSPEYVLRFSAATAAVKKIKLDMWNAIKAAVRAAG